MQPKTGYKKLDSNRRRVLRWYESWIFKVAATASVILFLGYGASIYIAVEGINAISNIAHREDVDEALMGHLDLLKQAHRLRQEIAIDRLKRLVPSRYQLKKDARTSKQNVHKWIDAAKLTELFTVEGVEVIEQPPTAAKEADAANGIAWDGPERLKVYQYIVKFPKGDTYDNFKTIEALRQAYKLFGDTLRGEIQPAMAKSAAIVLLLMFLLLIVTFWFTLRRFKSKVESIIDGFLYWSEIDDRFRFRGKWSGELKLITTQFNSMADEVDANRRRTLFLEKMASWQTIARKMAHEIKNPLTPIQMMISELQRRYHGEDESFNKLLNNAQKIIGEEINGLRRMVDSFSKFARLPEPQFAEADMHALLQSVADLQQAAFPQHQIKFLATGANFSAIVDEGQLRQVCLNLVKNAAEASGEKPVRIELSVEQGSRSTTIHVKDSGPGIPEDLQARIFEAYFTTKHTGPSPGMGLGLAICQKIVLDHGGTMNVHSVPGQTDFEITLPLEGQHLLPAS